MKRPSASGRAVWSPVAIMDPSAPFEPIQELEVQGYGCIRQATFKLSPLHALIGPNDSGKSTALPALRTVAQLAGGNFGPHAPSVPEPFDPMLPSTSSTETQIIARYSDGLGYGVRVKNREVFESVYKGTSKLAKAEGPRDWTQLGLLGKQSAVDGVVLLSQRVTPATMVRFDPNSLRKPSPQILSKDPIRFSSETGAGLASVYQAINSRAVDDFVAIRDRVRGFFPSIQNILVPTVDNNQVTLEAKLMDGTVVQAPALSEGLLYFLAYAALQYLEKSKLFLVEEPENGLHPSRISNVIDILREISKTGQVIIATHSPLVVNELAGNEISVVTRSLDAGTQVRLLRDVPGFEDASKVYQPGEFWVSYADGKGEEPLLTGTPRS
jgi:predicted ATPase